MKAIITGGAGFIGCHLTELCLSSDFEVVVIDNLSTGTLKNLQFAENNSKLTFVRADINDTDQYAEHFAEADFVFHLAGLADIVPSIDNPMEYHRVNVEGTLRLLELVKQFNIAKFVYAASSSCYGIPDNYPTSEKTPNNPMYPYALTKMLGEEYVMHWGKTYDIPVISLRLFNVYGPKTNTSGAYGAVFKVFLAQKIADRAFTVVGDGSQSRDFIYVTDVVRAFFMAAQSEIQNTIMNVGTGTPQTINHLVQVLGGKVEYIPKRPGEPDITHADIKLISKNLGWTPEISFEQGVQTMIDDIDYWNDSKVWSSSDISDATKTWFKYLKD